MRETSRAGLPWSWRPSWRAWTGGRTCKPSRPSCAKPKPEVQLGQALARPDWGVRGGVAREEGAEIVTAGIVVSSPVHDRGQGDRRRRAGPGRRAPPALAAVRAAAETEVRGRYAALDRQLAAAPGAGERGPPRAGRQRIPRQQELRSRRDRPGRAPPPPPRDPGNPPRLPGSPPRRGADARRAGGGRWSPAMTSANLDDVPG